MGNIKLFVPSSFQTKQKVITQEKWRQSEMVRMQIIVIAAINRLNAHLDNGLRTSINKYGRNGLSDAMDDIRNFNTKVYKK